MSFSLSHWSWQVSLLMAATPGLAIAPLGAQQGVDPDASSGGVLVAPYIVPHSSTVEPVSPTDKRRLKRGYVNRKAAERDTFMVLAQALPVTSVFPRIVPSPQLVPPATVASPTTGVLQPPVPLAAGARPSTSPPLAPAHGDLSTMPGVPIVESGSSQGDSRIPMPVGEGEPGDDDLPDTTMTALDSTGAYFIIRPVLRGEHLRPSTVDRILNLAREYTRRALPVTYILAVEVTPDDDDATDALISEADALRHQLIASGVSVDRVIVRDAAPTGPHSSLRIMLRGPQGTSLPSSTTTPAPKAPVLFRPMRRGTDG